MNSRISWDDDDNTGKRAEEPPPWTHFSCAVQDSHRRQAVACVELEPETESEIVAKPLLIAQNISAFVGSIKSKLYTAALSHAFSRLQQDAHEAAFRTVTDVIEFTKELCGSPVQIKESHDPEYPSERKVVLTAEIEADNAKLIAIERQWIKHVSRLRPQWGHVRLVLKRKK